MPEPNGVFSNPQTNSGREEGGPPGGEEQGSLRGVGRARSSHPNLGAVPEGSHAASGMWNLTYTALPARGVQGRLREVTGHLRSHSKLTAEAQNVNSDLPLAHYHTLSGSTRFLSQQKQRGGLGEGLLTSAIDPGDVPTTPSSMYRSTFRPKEVTLKLWRPLGSPPRKPQENMK